MSDIQLKINNEWQNIALSIYRVGAIYMSVDSTSPATLFGGTWIQLENRMLMGAGSSYTAGTTGGSASVTITTNNLPKHTHSVGAHSHGLNSHTHSVGAHAHGLNNHTHSYSKSATSTGGHTLTLSEIPSHNHGSKTLSGQVDITNNVVKNGVHGSFGGASGIFSTEGINHVMCQVSTSLAQGTVDDRLKVDATHTHDSNGGGGSHSHSITLSSANSDGPSTTNTANSTAFTSGPASGSTANSSAFNSGDGGFSNTALNTISPYLVVYMWKRTA